MVDFSELEKNINYIFSDKKILLEAFTHPSFKKSRKSVSYQRLEFLGDSVLSLIISDMLYKMYPKSDEGGLSKRHTKLVCSHTLFDIANQLKLGDYIRMDLGEYNTGGRTKKSNLENVLESLIGAIYLDGGYSVAKKFVHNFWFKIAENMQDIPANSRSLLQEWTQKKGLSLPDYKIVKKEGYDHNPLFTVKLVINDTYPSTFGTANSKKAAEYIASDKMLKHIKDKCSK